MELSLTANTPDAAPVCVGENVTLMVQVELPLRVDPQVVDATAKGPVTEMLMLLSVELPGFLRVNVLGLLVVPTLCLPKLELAGMSVTGAMPFPINAISCGEYGPLSVKARSPVNVPSWLGVKVTLTVHFAFGASVAPQVLDEMAKFALGKMLPMYNVPEPELVSVTFFGRLVSYNPTLPKLSEPGEIETFPLKLDKLKSVQPGQLVLVAL